MRSEEARADFGVAACSLEFFATEIHTRYETDIMPMLSRFILKSLIFLENSADYLLTRVMKMLALLGSYFPSLCSVLVCEMFL